MIKHMSSVLLMFVLVSSVATAGDCMMTSLQQYAFLERYTGEEAPTYLNGSGEGPITLLFNDVAHEGTIRYTPMGSISNLTVATFIEPGTPIVYKDSQSFFEITMADGAKIRAFGSGIMHQDPEIFNRFEIRHKLEIKGGTGRFVNASGVLMIRAYLFAGGDSEPWITVKALGGVLCDVINNIHFKH